MYLKNLMTIVLNELASNNYYFYRYRHCCITV